MRSVSPGTIEVRSTGVWRLRVTATDDYGETRRHSKTVKCRTKTQAKKELENWRLELLASHDSPTSAQGMTLHDYLEEYLTHCHDVKHLSPNTVRGYRDIVRNRWDPKLANVRLQDLSPKKIDDQVGWMRTTGSRTHGPLSAKTVNEALGFLTTALDRAVMLGYIPSNPAKRVLAMPKEDRDEIKALTEAEVKRMKMIVRGHPSYRFCDAVILSLDTGMRRGEICGLLWKDVDLEKGTIHVVRALAEGTTDDTYNGKTLEEKSPKSAKSRRWLSLPQSTTEMLAWHKETQRLRLLYNGLEQSPDTPVFCNDLGEHYRPSTYTSDFRSFTKQQKFDVTLHGLRHTHASLLLRNGTPIADVSRRLGHDSVDLTYRVYSHFIQGDDSKTAETWASATEPDQPYEGTPLCRMSASPEISRPTGPRLAQRPESLAQTRKEIIGNTQ